MSNTQENEEPKAGEWWLLNTSGGWIAEKEQLLRLLPSGDWLTYSGGRYYIQKPEKLICRVPPRFPRLRRFFSFFQKK